MSRHRSRRRALLRGQALVGSIGLLAAAQAQPSLVDPNLEAVSVVGGLVTPIGMAFIGPNDFFVIEKNTGQVKRVQNGAVTGIVLDLAVNAASERGLLGIALHPDFPLNPGVYLYWAESSTGSDTLNAAEIALMGQRIDRFAWNGSTLVFDRNIVLIRGLQADAGQPIRGNHDGGVVRFGPDRKLYAVIGDLGRRGFTQNLILGGPRPDDQFGGPWPDPAHRSGVVLRLNDDGSIPADNPFNRGGPMNNSWDAIWAYGVRNSFGMAFDPVSGLLWTQENGDDAFDEINLVTAGFNGGWIQVMGPLKRIHEFRSIELNEFGGSLQQIRWPPSNIPTTPQMAVQRLMKMPGSHYEDPKLSWKYAVPPAGIGFVDTLSLGPEYAGNMLVGAARLNLLNGWLMRLKLSPNRMDLVFDDPALADRVADNADKHDPTESESLIIGSNFGVVPSIETSPDGRVHVVSLDQGIIYELRRR